MPVQLSKRGFMALVATVVLAVPTAGVAAARVTAKPVKTPGGTKLECIYDADYDAYYLLATTRYGVAFYPQILDSCPQFSNRALIDTTPPGWQPPPELPKCEGPNHDVVPEGASICQWP